jgi:hypothetical protein
MSIVPQATMTAHPTVQQIPIKDPITVSSMFYSIKPFIVYPAGWISQLLLLILRPLVVVLHWLVWPFLGVANGLWAIVTLPFAVLIKFEVRKISQVLSQYPQYSFLWCFAYFTMDKSCISHVSRFAIQAETRSDQSCHNYLHALSDVYTPAMLTPLIIQPKF